VRGPAAANEEEASLTTQPDARPPEPAAVTDGVFRSQPFTIEPDWIDYNGHLNMAYYHVLFDRMIDIAFEAMGIGPSYVERTKRSVFSVEVHVCYLDEVRLEDTVEVSLRVLGHDAKRIHVFEEMRRVGDGVVAATSETMLVHVDLAERRVATFEADVHRLLEEAVRQQAHLPAPERQGRSIALPVRS